MTPSAPNPVIGRPIAGRSPASRAVEEGGVVGRILILSAAGVGDFVLGTPALRAIHQRFPGATVWTLTIPEVRPLAERCPYVDQVRTLNLRHSRSAAAWLLGAGRRELVGLIRELRGMRFDIAVNLYEVATWAGGVRMAAFLRAVGATRSVGRSSDGRGPGLDLASDREGHEIEAQLAVARLLGATATSDLPELWISDEDRRACGALLQTRALSGAERLACLHAGSAQPGKRWPSSRFAAVGRRLAGAGARVVLVGTQAEHALCGSLAQEIPGAVSVAGETSLPVLAALLQRASLLVTNDSGPMHMAAALGVPLVVPFGPEMPKRFGPRGRAACVVLSSPARPGGSPWWDGISADTVAEAAVRLFAVSAARAGRTEGTS